MSKKRKRRRRRGNGPAAMSIGKTTFKKRHPEIGARPGTLMIEEGAAKPRIRAITYTPQEQLQDVGIDDVAQLKPLLKPGTITWIDVQGFGDNQTIEQIGQLFSIHPLALEDIVNAPQRPKAETYGKQSLIITQMVWLDENQHVQMEQVTVLLGENYVITFQERYGDILDPLRERIRVANSRIRQHDSGYLMYAIVDTIVDGYYPVVDDLGDHLEELETVVMENPSTDALLQLNRTKNLLVNLRRAIWPQREAVNSLIREDNPLMHDDVRLYLRDTYDHCAQTAEVIEMYREMATGLVNIYLSAIANRQNDVMKVLTVMASVFIPLSFIAGVYGMNFENMPELHYRWSYPILWCVMLAVAIGMIHFFYRKGWLGGRGRST